MDRTCEVCGSTFVAKPFEVKRGRGKTCSHSCAASRAAASRRSQVGSANPNWKGGEVTPYREAKRKYRGRHPQKARAHMMVRDAIKRGELKREGCCECGEGRTHAHHDDYEKPLEVVWLCKKHHEQRHVWLRSNGIGLYYKQSRSSALPARTTPTCSSAG